MMGGTSPSITTLANGGYQIAFQANSANLYTIGAAGGGDTGLGMAAGTSPGITVFAAGGYQIAFQANSTNLYTIGRLRGGNSGLGMAPGTSPSISGVGQGLSGAPIEPRAPVAPTCSARGRANCRRPARTKTRAVTRRRQSPETEDDEP